MTAELLKLAGSVAAILFIAWLARHWQLGGDVRIRTKEQACAIADEIICGFSPVDVAVDKAGIGALLRDQEGRHLLIRRHGAQWAGRLLTAYGDTRLAQNFLTVGTGEKLFGAVTLDLGPDAQNWAAGLRRLKN